MVIELFALIIAFSAIAVIVTWTILTGNPPMPTSLRVRQMMISMLPLRLPSKSNGRIYELGAGWGGVSRALADHFYPIPVIGIEISPLPFAVAWLRNVLVPKSNLEVCYGNYLKLDLSEAVLVACFLSREALIELRPKLEYELAPEALIVSNTFRIPGWRALNTRMVRDLYRTPIYLYERSDAVARISQS